MRDSNVMSGNVRLAVRDYGGDGPAVVLLHGLSSNVCIWDDVASLLSAGHRVVAFDQRGHGHSDPAGDYGFPAVIADVDAVVEATALRDPVVVGHSWGASVALGYASQRRECPAVVCVDGGIFDLSASGSWDEIATRLRPPDMDGPAEAVFSRVAAMSDPIPWARRRPVIERSFPVGDDGIARRKLVIDDHMRIVRAMWEQQLSRVHEQVAQPAMFLLAGPHDGAENPMSIRKRAAADEIVARHSRFSVRWLPSVHDMPLLHPVEVADSIRDFVARLG